MGVNDCPHCGKPAIGFWRKSILGPARIVACRSCGRPVSVGWGTLVAALPVLAVVFGLSSYDAAALAWTLWMLVALAVSMALHWYFVRVVAR